MYYNPFNKQSSRLRKAMSEMAKYHIEKNDNDYKEKLTNSIK